MFKVKSKDLEFGWEEGGFFFSNFRILGRFQVFMFLFLSRQTQIQNLCASVAVRVRCSATWWTNVVLPPVGSR